MNAQGRRTALLIALAGLFWIAATWAGGQFGWAQRTRALFDLAALAVFGLALWQIFTLWRARRNDKG